MGSNRLLPLSILTLALWLRAPYVTTGLPYLHQEDEAHHFNRVIEMMKTGDYNPRYFHKPSLHFYLRLPVAAVSFLNEVRTGRARDLKEIRTRDAYGVSGYAYSTSHRGMVKYNRAFSVMISLGVVALAYLLALRLAGAGVAAVAAILTAVAPPLVEHSAVIGVDTPMAFFCLLAVYFAVRLVSTPHFRHLLISAIAAGLAVSTKYNALPVALVPIMACLAGERRSRGWIACALLLPAAAFFAASPYILVSFPLFLDDLGFEVWHYRIAGHEGYSEEPGIAQLVFYLRWFGSHAVGWAALVLAGIGMVRWARRDPRQAVVAFAFPLLFLFLMVMQRANFTRNMVAELPFLAIAAALAIDGIVRRLNRGQGLLFAAAIAISIQPAAIALRERRVAAGRTDSRIAAAAWLQEHRAELGPIAMIGELQFEPWIARSDGVSVVPAKEATVESLAARGFETAVLPEAMQPDRGRTLASFPGRSKVYRVVVSPAIRIVAVK